jgi:spermidine/putrescine transport system substrate-binding protein
MPQSNPLKARLHAGRLMSRGQSRRRFIQLSAAAASGFALTNCARNLSNSGSTSESPAASGDDTLRIYTWANYIDDELLQKFQEKTGISAVVDTFDSNEAMLAKMQAGGGGAYSIIYPSDYMVTEMTDLEMLQPLDASKITGLDNLRSKWQDPVYDPGNAHSVPVVWGTTGLVYNPELLETELTGWDYIWNETDALTRKLTLINDPREVLGAVLAYMGNSFNSEDPEQIQAAYEKLVEIKPAIANFITNGWEDQLASGDLLISMAYSTDAIALMEENPDLRYVVPETGSSLWTDTMVIPKGAPNPDAAYEWINFILVPENSAIAAERLKLATPNQAAFDLLPKELKDNTNLFPPEAVLANCEGIAPVSQEAAETYDKYWTQLTSA